MSTDFPLHWLQIDDFEHHQSWRLDAVARRWEVPSHSDAKFVVSGPVTFATGKLAGATGTLMLEGNEDLGTGKFTEGISGLICVDLAP